MANQVIKFVNEVKQEAGKVTWPNRKETGISLIMVIIMVAIAGIFFFISDLAISGVIKEILGI